MSQSVNMSSKTLGLIGPADDVLRGPILRGSFAWVQDLQRRLTGRAVSQKLLLIVTSQLAVMLASGCDLCAGLDALSRQQAHPRLKQILSELHEGVKQGQAFSQALAKHPDVFSTLYVTMIRAGESSGLLRHMLTALQVMIRNQIRIVSSIRGALMYPVILICVAITAITVMTTFVLPSFAKVFRESHVPLPAITLFVINASEFIAAHILLLLLGLVVVIVGTIWLMHVPSIRRSVDAWSLKLPLVGKAIQLSICVRSIQTIGMLIKSGLPLADSLALTRDMMTNVHYWEFFDGLRAHIAEGKTLSSDFDRTTLFPAMVTQMISVGEQTGTLAQVCLDIASFHEEELQERIKILTTALEPIIIIFLGIFVGLIAISVILPMFRLNTTVH